MIIRRWHVIGIPLACVTLFGLSVPWWLKSDMFSTGQEVLLVMLAIMAYVIAFVAGGLVCWSALEDPLKPVVTIKRTPKPPPPDPSKPGGEVSEVTP